MDIRVGAVAETGLNIADIGADVAVSGASVTLGSPNITGTNFLPAYVVGLAGFQITLDGQTYTAASVTSRSAMTLTENYAGSTGTASGTLHKFAVLRVYAMTPFVPSGSVEVVQSGAPGSTAWFRRYAVSVVSDGGQNIAHFPEIELPATTDSSVPTARYFAGLYTRAGSFIQAFPGRPDEFRLTHTDALTSWAQIVAFNSSPVPAPPEPVRYVTEQQLDARFPTGVADQLLYFEQTGDVLTPLTLSAEFDITNDTLSLTNPAVGYDQVQEEGGNLAKRRTLNFIGSAFTAADDSGNSRTNVTADSDLNALASNSTTGLWTVTGSGTGAARTLTGTSNEIAVSNGNGVSGNPTFSLPSSLTLTGKTITGGTYSSPTINTPTIAGGTHTALTGLGIRSTGTGAFDLQIVNTENLTANRALTVTLGNAARTLSLGGNLTTGGTFSTTGAFSTAGAFTTSGANSLTLTTTGSTNITLPTTGTLSTLAGSETLTNKTLTSPRIGTSILDTNGNELATLTATGSAVNEISLANAATGNGPTIGVSGGDTNANLNINAKGTGRVVLKGYPYALQVDTTTVSTTTTGPDNLHSFSLPANSLANNGDYLIIEYSGRFANSEDDKSVNARIGGQTYTEFSNQDLDSNNQGWTLRVRIVRLSTTSVRVSYALMANLVGVTGANVVSTSTNGFYAISANKDITGLANLTSNATTLLVVGASSAVQVGTNPVTQNLSIIELVQR